MSRHHPYRPPPSGAALGPGLRRRGNAPPAQVLQQSAAGVLSFGLDPEDLSLLAVRALPHVLHQLQGRRGLKPLPPSRAPPLRPASRDWEQRQNQPVQYLAVQDPAVRPTSSAARRSEDPWGWGSAGPPSSSSRHVADQDYRSCLSGPGRPASRVAPLPDQQNRCRSGTGSTRPSSKQALDFHGRTPPTFPYSCSLCDITVLSERVWAQHINSTVHADGQLSLLQQCPTWDCRMETVSRKQTRVHAASLAVQRRRDGDRSERQQEGRPPPPAQRANQSESRWRTVVGASNQKQQKARLAAVNHPERGGVVCVKFPARSVDEADLRTLTEPFGKITKVLMFPSLAFVELGSADQAQDLVRFHSGHPAVVNGAPLDFSISNTFSFLQSSKVISFVPAPSGEDGRSDLISVVKRFGAPLYTLFLPSKAFVEMKNEAEAQKMVNYYSSNRLRINDDCVLVSFSGEYKSLERVPSAKTYEEEAGSVQRTSSTSKESSRDRETRSRSRDCYRIEKGTRSRSRSREGCRERKNLKRETRTSSGERERSRREGRSRTRSRSRDKSGSKSTRPDGTQKSEEPQKPAERRGTPEVSTEKEAADEEEEEEEEEESEEESDIEGMGVLAEDGENLLEEEEEEEDDDDDGDEDEEVKKMETVHQQTPDEDEEVKKMETVHQQTPDEDEEVKKMETEEDQGFVETSSSSEPLKVARDQDQDQDQDPVSSGGSRLVGSVSHKYQRLVNGSGSASLPVQPPSCWSSAVTDLCRGDVNLDQTGGTRGRSSRLDHTNGTSGQARDSSSKQSPEVPGDGPEMDFKETEGQKPATRRKTRSRRCPGDDTAKSKGTPEDKVESGETPEVEPEWTEEHPEPSGPELKVSKSPSHPEPSEQEAEHQSGPTGGVAEPQRIRTPVGAEFVRPVVGYFCNLCQLIFCDEDEAKVQHCSSPEHRRRYQVAMETGGQKTLLRLSL